MRHGTPHNQRIIERKVIVALLVAIAALLILQMVSSVIAVGEPQLRRQQNRTRPRPKSEPAKASAYFKHETHLEPVTKLTCSRCHTGSEHQPTRAEGAATQAVAKTYPYHDKCLNCHQKTPPQFFRGVTPVICSVCHTRSTPRLTRNDLHPFPKQSADTIVGDLSLKFRHDSPTHLQVQDCMTCHLGVVQLDFAKADVSISTCAATDCHRKSGVQPAFDGEMLLIEDEDLASENQHACTGCHSTTIGGKSPPCTHLSTFDPSLAEFAGFTKSAKIIAGCKK